MTELVPTQADREAAADMAERVFDWQDMAARIRAGASDGLTFVQVFTRHRISSANEAIEEAAKIADRARDTVYVQPTDWDYGALDACHVIARDIRALKSGSASHGG